MYREAPAVGPVHLARLRVRKEPPNVLSAQLASSRQSGSAARAPIVKSASTCQMRVPLPACAVRKAKLRRIVEQRTASCVLPVCASCPTVCASHCVPLSHWVCSFSDSLTLGTSFTVCLSHCVCACVCVSHTPSLLVHVCLLILSCAVFSQCSTVTACLSSTGIHQHNHS